MLFPSLRWENPIFSWLGRQTKFYWQKQLILLKPLNVLKLWKNNSATNIEKLLFFFFFYWFRLS